MASGLLIKQKQLLAGDGIAINHGETASTISLAENALDNAVRIYDATVDAETGVITITDGTQVADLAIGDEIRTPDGVLKKVANSTEVASDPSTGDIQVMGFTNPTAANGLYEFQSDRKWKHTSANYWITTSGNAWVISSLETPPAPSAGLCYSETADEEMPYDVTSWQRVSSYGTPLLYPAAATAIVSGITSQQTANGKYLPTGNAYEWKHETEDWWITLYSRGTMNYPCIANTPNPTGDILSSSEYVATYTVFVLPWNVPTWSRSGSTVVEMGDANIVVTDTVGLFEYASTSVASSDIVQSVNGNKPDASGNVTIEIDAQTRADEQVTASSLTPDSHRYTVTGANTASISVVDDTGKIVMPDMYQVGDDVEIDFTNFSVGDTPWTIQFSAGQRGQQGASAYQSWLNTGHEGTESDFLEWLRGEASKYSFTSSNLAGTILTLNTNSIITGVIDDSGKQWNLDDEAVVYGASAVTVELAGVMARKGVATISGTWKIALYGSAIN